MPKFILVKTPGGIMPARATDTVTFNRPFLHYGIVSAFAEIEATDYFAAIAEFKRLFSEPEEEEAIGDLIEKTTQEILDTVYKSGGFYEDKRVIHSANTVAKAVIAKCLGIEPSCMDAPDVLRQSVDRYRG
jgi:hypothetical protein